MENSYSYSPKDIETARKIRKEFSQEKSDLDELKALQQKAVRNAQIPSLVLGIAFALVFGAGMCLSMLTPYFIQGIVIGLAGIAGVSVNPFIYRSVLQREKVKVEDRVMELSQRIING